MRIGTLDDPDRFPPDIHIFASSKQPWLTLDGGAPVVAEYYQRSEHWPAESVARYDKALGRQAAATRQSRSGPWYRAAMESSAPRYAGFWVRFAASMIDSVWLTVVMWAPILIVAVYELMDPDGTAYLSLFLGSQFVLPAAISVGCWRQWQATPGKRACRIRVVDARSLEPASVGWYSLRYLAYFVSMLPLGLGLFWVGWEPKKRGFHDMLARTVVIHA